MKKHIIIALCLALAACGGGTGSTGPQGQPGTPGKDGAQGIQGAPGKSAYEIWLDAGNTGTEQDFLDSLVANNNTSGNNDKITFTTTKEYLDYLGYSYDEHSKNWPNHGKYTQYVYHASHGTSTSTNGAVEYTLNEKEMHLGNYGVYLTKGRQQFDDTDSFAAVAYTHNRNGAGANVYTPETNAVFKGGTLAYLYNATAYQYGPTTTDAVLLTGEGTFTYGDHKVLELSFDNYYTITFDNNGALPNTQGNVIISGNNSTGVEAYDLQPGEYTNTTVKYFLPGWQADGGYVKSGEHEEAFITYGLDAYKNDDRYITSTNSNFSITGAFGGTKQ